MPQQSKYSDSQFETLMNDIVFALEKNKANRDLSLMALGNVIMIIHMRLEEFTPKRQNTRTNYVIFNMVFLNLVIRDVNIV